MPPNHLNSDVGRFTTHELNLSCNKSGCWRLQKGCCTKKRIVLLFTTKSVHVFCAIYLPMRNLFCGKWRNSRVTFSNQRSVFTQLACSLFPWVRYYTVYPQKIFVSSIIYHSFSPPISHRFPANPAGQLQLNPLIRSLHVPLLTQGLLLHSFMSVTE